MRWFTNQLAVQLHLTCRALREMISAMEDNRYPPPPPPLPSSWPPPPPPPPPPTASKGGALKKFFGPLVAVGVLVVKFFGKLKFVIMPAIKFLPMILKTGGTMILSVWAYAMFWGVWFAVGFVVLIFIHECGHLVAAKRLGLKVGAPVFIPFMGAFIALKEAPRDAWIEAQVGYGGPLFGALASGACELIHLATGNPLFRGLAYTGFLLNLFNLAPIGMLDGGRIVTALSPWLWVVGFVIMIAMTILHPNFILVLILLLSLPRLFFLFRKKSDTERRYFEVSPAQRLVMGALYFGLIALLVLGMKLSHIPHETLERGGKIAAVN